QKVIGKRSIRRAGWVGACLRRQPRRRACRDPHQRRLRQRLLFENAIAPSLARRLREAVIFRQLPNEGQPTEFFGRVPNCAKRKQYWSASCLIRSLKAVPMP